VQSFFRGKSVLITGASGYVGGRLLSALEDAGVRLRCVARRPDYLRARLGAETEIVQGDVLDSASLEAALRDVDTAYYLVHSMGSAGSFEEKDREGARNFAAAARAAGVRRIIYLGGLGDSGGELSTHLRSRHEVENLLGTGGVPVTVRVPETDSVAEAFGTLTPLTVSASPGAIVTT